MVSPTRYRLGRNPLILNRQTLCFPSIMKLFFSNPGASKRRGWSLAEMLVVITVVGFLLAMSAPNLFSLLRSSELSSQGEVIRNWLSQAQQQALSTGNNVEVRFFLLADAANAQIVPEYRACDYIQYDSDKIGPDGRPLMVRPVEILRLNDPVLFSRPLSSMLSDGNSGLTKSDVDGIQLFGKDVQSKRVPYRSFRFRPDGSTDLPKNQPSYLTLVADEGSAATTKNFFCLQIDPYNGSIQEYRP